MIRQSLHNGIYSPWHRKEILASLEDLALPPRVQDVLKELEGLLRAKHKPMYEGYIVHDTSERVIVKLDEKTL